jgi:hypothetical protein
MTWNRLLADWQNYLAVMVERPYDPDRVQGLGMRFAEAWNYHKVPICFMLGERHEEVQLRHTGVRSCRGWRRYSR